MSRRTIVTIVLALVFAGAATLLVNQMFAQRQETPKPETAPVVVASVDLAGGQMITANQVKSREWPKDLIPPGAITQVDEAIGRSPFSSIVKDEPLLDKKLAAKGAGRGLKVIVDDGMRAFTIHTPTAASGVAGFILPGDNVDVLFTMGSTGAGDASGGGSTTTLLQCVKVLAVDQRLEATADNKVDPRDMRSVTLLVNPDQANKLALAGDKGTLHLSLRNSEDVAAAATEPATLDKIRFHRENPLDSQAKDQDSPVSTAGPNQPLVSLEVRTLNGRQHGRFQVDQVKAVSNSP